MIQRSVTFRNAAGRAIRVWVEPWGDYLDLAPDATLKLLAASPQPGEFHVEHRPSEIAIYAWWGCTAQALDGETGEDLKPDCFSVPVPSHHDCKHMTWKSFWRASLDARTRPAAERVCERIAHALGSELTELTIEPHEQGGHTASWVGGHNHTAAAAFIVEVIGQGQKIATGWTLLGSVETELEGVASTTGSSHISVPGIALISWRAPLGDAWR